MSRTVTEIEARTAEILRELADERGGMFPGLAAYERAVRRARRLATEGK